MFARKFEYFETLTEVNEVKKEGDGKLRNEKKRNEMNILYLFILGESAGGNLALAVALKLAKNIR